MELDLNVFGPVKIPEFGVVGSYAQEPVWCHWAVNCCFKERQKDKIKGDNPQILPSVTVRRTQPFQLASSFFCPNGLRILPGRWHLEFLSVVTKVTGKAILGVIWADCYRETVILRTISWILTIPLSRNHPQPHVYVGPTSTGSATAEGLQSRASNTVLGLWGKGTKTTLL